jgi:outer membrane protein OmpA-like peptidoglycan-associated protein
MRPVLVIGCLLVAFAAAMAAAPALAKDDVPGELGIIAGFHRLDRDVVGPRRDPDWSPVLGLRIGANMHRPWSQFVEGLYGRFDSDAGDKTTLVEGRVGLERNFPLGSGAESWYLAGALGWADANLPATRDDFGRPLASLGIGLRCARGLYSRWHLELREEWWMGDEGLGGKDVANTQVLLGWAIGLKDTREPMFRRGSRSLILEGVTFITDSAELTGESIEALDRTAASLRAWPEVRVEVGGHTDSVADDAYNRELSQRRAETVRAYLIHSGISARRLEARGYGEARPIAPNDTEAGRARNRRVELTRID